VSKIATYDTPFFACVENFFVQRGFTQLFFYDIAGLKCFLSFQHRLVESLWRAEKIFIFDFLVEKALVESVEKH